jgi:hypothetical protein
MVYSDEEVSEIAKTLLRHQDLFDTSQTKYGAAKGLYHSKDTGNAMPTCQHLIECRLKRDK